MKPLLCMLRTGCPWRDLPSTSFHWHTVYGHFARWRDLGIWDRILKALTRKARGRLRYIDATYIRVHRCALDLQGDRTLEAIGRSRSALATGTHTLVDGRGRALKLLLCAGNVANGTVAPDLVAELHASDCGTLVDDKGDDSDALRELLHPKGIFACLALNATREQRRAFHRGSYRSRRYVENFFCALERHRRLATRYDTLAASLSVFVTLNSMFHWIG